jgi:hypothetical protein
MKITLELAESLLNDWLSLVCPENLFRCHAAIVRDEREDAVALTGSFKLLRIYLPSQIETQFDFSNVLSVFRPAARRLLFECDLFLLNDFHLQQSTRPSALHDFFHLASHSRTVSHS